MFLERIPVRLRLSLGHAIWMAILFLGIGVGVFKLVEINLNQSVDAALIASAKSIRSSRSAISYRSPFTQSFLREFFGEKFIRPYAQLVDLSGRVSARTENVRVNLPVTPQASARAEQGLMTLETLEGNDSSSSIGSSPMRLITLPILRHGRFNGELVQVGAPLDAMRHTLNKISLMLWIAMPAGLVLSVLFGYIFMASSLKPVTAVTRAASKLGSEDLDFRLKLPRAHDEIRELTATFNTMADRLQDAFGRVRRFAGDVSHELRTPLTVLRGEAELALRRERSKEEYKDSLTAIAKESVHMTHIVEDLLLLARAQNKSVAIHWDPIPIPEFVHMLTDSVKSVAENKSIAIETQYESGVNSISGSPNYLTLAIKNIVLNAIKHSPSGSSVSIQIEQTKTFTSFKIKDTGEGIPEDALPYIFDAFYRADTARNRQAGGSGIGLSLTKALINLHDGQVKVESKINSGSTFTVSIPNKSCSV